jgi:hypothetical protein
MKLLFSLIQPDLKLISNSLDCSTRRIGDDDIITKPGNGWNVSLFNTGTTNKKLEKDVSADFIKYKFKIRDCILYSVNLC